MYILTKFLFKYIIKIKYIIDLHSGVIIKYKIYLPADCNNN